MTNPTGPILGDSSDRDIQLAKAKRVAGGTAVEWLDFLHRNPDASLPSGVGGLLVSFLTEPVDQNEKWHRDAVKRYWAEILQRLAGDVKLRSDVLAVLHPMRSSERTLGRYMMLGRKGVTTELLDALRWHCSGEQLSATNSRSYQHVQAILNYAGIDHHALLKELTGSDNG